ncbi:MAG: hypothetical protein ACK5KM_10695, partial [Hyphomicrobiaceae bacterium]
MTWLAKAGITQHLDSGAPNLTCQYTMPPHKLLRQPGIAQSARTMLIGMFGAIRKLVHRRIVK